MSHHPHLVPPLAGLLGLVFGLSECLLGLLRRSGAAGSGLDRGSLRLFWILVPLAVVLSQWAAIHLRSADIDPGWARPLGIAVMIAGMVLRGYSILYLGRWFTVDIAIRAEQPLIQAGPFSLVRHPSYSGALLVLIGLGLACANLAAALLSWLPALPAFIYRIRIEEEALGQAFGARWAHYCRHTRRLLPGVY